MLLNPSTAEQEIGAGAVTEFPRAAPRWGAATRFLFRFAFAYLVLYSFPFPLTYIPYVGMITIPYQKLWHALVPWVGKRLFQLDITVFPNGSGDTTYNYVEVLCFAAFALAAALIWTLLDRRRPNYARLHEWLRVYVRFVLATALITYGAIKIIKSQFPDPSLDRLLQPFGDASPMGLLWTFMGVSKSYNIFSGAAEMLGGLLLTARRTTLLGALVAFGAMANVAMLNFSYDVPVKLYSCHLLAMALFLALPDLRRLADLFVFNRPVAPADMRPLFQRKWLHRGALALRTLLIAAFCALSLNQAYQGVREYSGTTSKTPFYGIWNVDLFEVGGQVRPPLITDESRWRRVVFSYPGVLALQLMSDHRQRYWLEIDDKKKTMTLNDRDDRSLKGILSYTQPQPGRLNLEGTLEGRKIHIGLRRTKTPEFLLINRGFHWINEQPFSR